MPWQQGSKCGVSGQVVSVFVSPHTRPLPIHAPFVPSYPHHLSHQTQIEEGRYLKTAEVTKALLNEAHAAMYKARSGELVFGQVRVDDEKVAELEGAVNAYEEEIAGLQRRAAAKRSEHVLVDDAGEGSREQQGAALIERSLARRLEKAKVGTHSSGLHVVNERKVEQLAEEKDVAGRASSESQARASAHALTQGKESDELKERFVAEKVVMSAEKRSEMVESRKANTMVIAMQLKKKDMCVHGVRRFGAEAMECRWCDTKKE